MLDSILEMGSQLFNDKTDKDGEAFEGKSIKKERLKRKERKAKKRKAKMDEVTEVVSNMDIDTSKLQATPITELGLGYDASKHKV